jgi:hypothetical protein
MCVDVACDYDGEGGTAISHRDMPDGGVLLAAILNSSVCTCTKEGLF